jgi:hypothetical protein
MRALRSDRAMTLATVIRKNSIVALAAASCRNYGIIAAC